MSRNLTVCAISCPPVETRGDNNEQKIDGGLKRQLEWIDRAAHQKPDVILLPEIYPWLGVPPEDWKSTAQTLRDPVFTETAARAKHHGCYVLCPMILRKGRYLYNALLAIDGKGNKVAEYHKVVPTVGEMEAGIRPGRKPAVLDTPLGRFGFAICFDLNFEEVFQSAKKQGAEIIFFSSMYRGGLQNQIWAYQYEMFFVGATITENSLIVNPLGRILAESSEYQQIQTVTLNLDCQVLHLDYNEKKFSAIEKKYGRTVTFEVLSPEALFLLTCHHPRKSVDDIIREFGLETRQAYYSRARRTRKKHLQ